MDLLIITTERMNSSSLKDSHGGDLAPMACDELFQNVHKE